MDIKKAKGILKDFNDGYTFQQCETCFKFNEKDSCCNKEKCEELVAIETVLNELEKKDKVIDEYEKECRMFKAFCRRVRRDDKHNVDEFNQGQEHKCNQFLNLLAGEENWDFEGKYFDETEKEIDKAENVGE